MDNLLFRRQFLFSSERCAALNDWQCEVIGNHHLYVHPDCELTRLNAGSTVLVLIGSAIDSRLPDKSNTDVLEDISNTETREEISEKLYSIVGRFVLIVQKAGRCAFFHDPCGLRTVYYSRSGDQVYAASQPTLLQLVTEIRKGRRYHEYFRSRYRKSIREHWLPTGTSLYDGVHHLAPNHYWDVSGFSQIRYWPNKPLIKSGSLDNAVKQFSMLLRNTMLAVNKRYKPALPLTAGWDSRIILSACKEIADDVLFYTLQYRNLTNDSTDIRIPRKLLSHLGCPHMVINTLKPPNEHFLDLYGKNTDNSHIDDWGLIANGMFGVFPSDRISIKGNCAEIGRIGSSYRCLKKRYMEKQSRMPSLEELLFVEPGWMHIDFVRNRMAEWYEGIRHREVNFGYDLYDLHYWEHKMGSWQAQCQLEWDIVHETFTPFNNRALIDVMLGVDIRFREYPDYIFFTKAMQLLWKEVLSVPVSPKSVKKKLRISCHDMLVRTGLADNMKCLNALNYK